METQPMRKLTMYLSKALLRVTLIFLCFFSFSALPAEIDAAKATPSPAANTKNTAFQQWDDAQAEAAKRFNERDHQTCINAGFVPRSWGNPDTEKYYLCRARLIEERALPLPAGLNKTTEPRAALFFRQKAHEAQYAFRAVDEEAHQTCMNQGGAPGELDDPKTRLYYECRSKLAEKEMGFKIAMLFRQKVEESTNAIMDSERCNQLGLKKEDPAYGECQQKALVARQCLQNIPKKLEKKANQDALDCKEEGIIQLPDTMAKGKNRSYATSEQLEEARLKLFAICIRERKDMTEQYKAGLTLECKAQPGL